MADIYFAVENSLSLTDCVQSNDTALVLLPGAKQPVMIATYCERLYPGLRTLLGIGNPEAIIKQHAPTLTSNPPGQDLLEKRAELDTASRFCNRLRSELSARVGIFIKFLGSRKLLDRKLYPLNDKLKQKLQPNNKELVPLIEAVYTHLRKTAAANAKKKQKLRDFVESGVGEIEFFDWLSVNGIPELAIFRGELALLKELAALDTANIEQQQQDLEAHLKLKLEQFIATEQFNEAQSDPDFQHWLSTIFGAGAAKRFFGTIKSIERGSLSQDCVKVVSAKHPFEKLNEFGKLISLSRFSSLVAAVDRALSHLVLTLADCNQEIKSLTAGKPLHSGLLIRGLLGDDDPIQILYPESLVLTAGNRQLGEQLIKLVAQSFKDGSFAATCASRYGIHASDLNCALIAAVSHQKHWLRLLPREVHLLASAIETRIRLVEQSKTLGQRDMRHPMIRRQILNLNRLTKMQVARCQKLARQLKQDFCIDPAKLFTLDEVIFDDLRDFFDGELDCLKIVIDRYLDERKDIRETASKAKRATHEFPLKHGELRSENYC